MRTSVFRTLKALALVLTLLSTQNVKAESLLEMEKNDLLSIFSKENRQIIIYGTAATVLLAILEDQISDPAQAAAVRHKPLGKWSALGDYSGQIIPNALYVIGMGGYGLLADDSSALKKMSVMVRATLSASIVSTALKTIVREPRPHDPSVKNSFPSGHSTTAFAFASVIGAEHGPWAGAAAYSLATLVALSRINDNRHYLHDVVGGAAIGLSYGISISRRANKLEAESAPAVAMTYAAVLPTPDLDGLATAVGFSF